MFKNIGKTIRVLAIVLAALCFLGFAALGTMTLIAALDAAISYELYVAGLQAAIVCFALSILTPFLNLILYGFGTLISSVQAQAEDGKKTKEMLQAALSNGMLSEEIARKSAQAQAKLISHLLAHASDAEKAEPKKNSRAPVQRPVKDVEKATVQETAQYARAQEAPTQEEHTVSAYVSAPATREPADEKENAEESPVQPAPAFIPVVSTPFRAPTPAVPTETASILQPLSNDNEIF